MTELEIEQAEKEAKRDAKWLRLMLLLASTAYFNAELGLFYVDGEEIDIDTVRGYLNRIEKRIGKRLLLLTDNLAKGKITLAEWKRGFDRHVTSAHVLAGALAIGSIGGAVRNADLQARIASELRYGDNFRDEIEKGKAGSAAQQAARAKSYLMAATITYGILELIMRRTASRYTEARRIRRRSESCEGCVREAYIWRPIEKVPPIGSLDCGGRCRCYLEYR